MKPSAGILAAALALGSATSSASACACGCGVFEVGASMLPTGDKADLFLRYDFLDQSENWSGTSGAPAAGNDDKRITTNFFTLGGQYRFADDWSAMAEVPVWDRRFRTEGDEGPGTFRHAALGDVRLMVNYSGLSSGASTTGITLGVKLPTGDTGYSHFDWDVSIGSGATDALVGLYHAGPLSHDGRFAWYAQAMWDKPLATRAVYKPGGEIDGALGLYYAGFATGSVGITPMLQTLFASRSRDGGPEADPQNTGYTRVLLAPGIEFTFGQWSVYGDVEFPVYQDVNGDQLVAHQQFKLVLSYALPD